VDRRAFLVAGAALAAAPSSALARLAGGTPVALVTADLESRVAAVELSSGRVLRSIETAADPRSIESCAGTLAVVAHTAGGVVSVLDGRTLAVRRVLKGFAEPRYTAASPDGRLAYVTDSVRGEVVVLDVRRGVVLWREDVGGPARHISLHGPRLWVALGTKARDVAVLDTSVPERPRLLRTFRPPYLAHDVAFTPAGRRVWVTSGDRGTVGIYGARSGRLLVRLAADAPPQHVTFVGDRAHVTSGDDGLLRVHALDGRLLRTTRVPLGSYNVQEGCGVVLTPSLSRGTLCVVSSSGRLLREVRAARSSHDACFVMSR
jgi:DNA-binding beta-propeller fold protein YncE